MHWCAGFTNQLFKKWIYAIKEWRKNGSWDKFIYAELLTDINTDAKIKEFYELEWFFKDDDSSNKARSWAMVTFTWTYLYLSWSAASGNAVTWNISDLLWNGVEFYRIARVYGIYCKTENDSNQEVGWALCNNNSDPKEMRFCVKTFYKLGAWTHSSELCSIMTNFME